MRINGGMLGAVLGGALLTLTACAEEPPIVADPTPTVTPGETSTSSTPTTAPPTGSAVVALVDAGRQPRRELRLELDEGDTQQSTMTLTMDVGFTINGKKASQQSAPPMSMGLDVEILDVTADGSVEARFGYGAIDVQGDSEMARKIEQGLKGLDQVSGTLRLTPRGEFLEGELAPPPGLAPELTSTLESFDEQLRSMAVPLPEEAVGVGATWTVSTAAKLNGIETESAYRYRLLEFVDGGVRLAVAVEMTAPEQSVELPGMPDAVNTYVNSMDMKGSGEVLLEFGQALPVSSTMVTRGQADMTMWDSSNSVDMQQDMNFRVEFEPR